MQDASASPRTPIQRRYTASSAGAGVRDWSLNPGEEVVALQRLANDRLLLLGGLHEGQPQTAHLVAGEIQRRLDRDRVGGDGERLVQIAQAVLDLLPEVGLVDDPAHLAADEVGGDEDAARPAEVHHLGEDVVVAREQVHAVDRREVLVPGLLHGDYVVDLGQLGEQVVRHVRGRAAGDVVGHDRLVGGGRDRVEVGLDAAAVRPVVVRGDHEHGVHADGGGAP